LKITRKTAGSEIAVKSLVQNSVTLHQRYFYDHLTHGKC